MDPVPAVEVPRRIARDICELANQVTRLKAKRIGTLPIGFDAEMDPNMHMVIDDAIRTRTQAAYAATGQSSRPGTLERG